MPSSPTIKIINLQQERHSTKKFRVLGDTSRSLILKALQNKQQIVFFINRKGMATSIICQDCGYVFKCPNCDIPLTFHKSPSGNYLLCHHCNYKKEAPLICPACGGHRLLPLGIGTERIKEELKTILHLTSPNVNKNNKITIEIIEGEMEDKKELLLLEKFNKKQIQVLIGTEALLRPQLKKADIAVIPSLDPLLFFPDYQSEERVFHYLLRIKKITKKLLIIQTFLPQHKIFLHLSNNTPDKFFQEELKWRREHLWPPYAQLIKLEFRSKDFLRGEKIVKNFKNKISAAIQRKLPPKQQKKFIILGPSPSFIAKEKGYYKWNALIKFIPQRQPIIKKELLYFGLKNLLPALSPEELSIRNKILLTIPQKWIIDVNPKDTL
ncbi:hypothetical protein J7K70_01270 [bacterium]|nr:hypothetical protein [bacterium]